MFATERQLQRRKEPLISGILRDSVSGQNTRVTLATLIAFQRLHNQHITPPRRGSPAEIVAALGAVQAQEYPFAKWALALRMATPTTDTAIEAAVDRGDILRTHALRPTWHFVAAADIVWIQQLTGARVHARLATYLSKFGIEKRTLIKAATVIERALGAGRYLTRQELRARLVRAGITLNGTPLALVVMYVELEHVICSGPRRGKQFTYALVSERAPKARARAGDEALGELTRRYLASHGPATVRDFAWWSSLTTADVRRGLDITSARPLEQHGRTYWTLNPRKAPPQRSTQVSLLPIYDEFLVAYRDRVAVPHGPSMYTRGPMKHALVIDGQVAGTWTIDRNGKLSVMPVRRLTSAERTGVEAEAGRFATFIGIDLRTTGSIVRYIP